MRRRSSRPTPRASRPSIRAVSRARAPPAGRARQRRRHDVRRVEAGLVRTGAAGEAWSMKRSGSTSGRTFRPWSSRPAVARYCSTWLAKPPTEPSSMVISTSCSRARRRDQIGVERLGEARIGHRGAEALGAEILGRDQAFAEARAEVQDRDLGALAQDAALADLERRAPRRQLDADALAARIAEGRGPVVDLRRPSPPCASARARRPPP